MMANIDLASSSVAMQPLPPYNVLAAPSVTAFVPNHELIVTILVFVAVAAKFYISPVAVAAANFAKRS